MGKVNWIEAKILYTRNVRVSYSVLARHYGAPLSTVKSYSNRHGWVAERRAFYRSKAEIILKDTKNELAEIEKRHLYESQFMQSVSHAALIRVAKDMNENEISNYHTDAILRLIKSIGLGINLEAAILGMQRTKIKQVIEHRSEDDLKQPRLNPEELPPLLIDEEIKYLERTLKSLRRMQARGQKTLGG